MRYVVRTAVPMPSWWSAVVKRKLAADYGSTRTLTIDDVRRAKTRVERDFVDHPDVMGIGIARPGREPGVVVRVRNEAVSREIPNQVGKVTVLTEIVSELPIAH